MWLISLQIFAILHVFTQLVLAKTNGILLVAEFRTRNVQDTADLVAYLKDLSKIAIVNPNITQYAVLAPATGDGKTMFTVEAYSNQEALDAHLASLPVQNLFTFLESISVTPIVSLLDINHNLEVTKSRLLKATAPWILLQEITYKAASAIPTLSASWQDVVSAAGKEDGTLHFGVYTDPKNTTKLWTFEAYESFDYFVGVHARGTALAELNIATGSTVTEMKGAELGQVGGFLGK